MSNQETVYQIDNLTTQSFMIYLSDFHNIRILPGLNLGIGADILELIKAREHLNTLIDDGMWQVTALNVPEIYEDKATGITFTDDSGEKVPVTNALIDGKVVPLTTGTVFKPAELKAQGIPSSLIRKLTQLAPESGWKSKEQIISSLELKEGELEHVGKLEV